MSRQAQTICPCSGWSRDVGSSIHQPPLMLPQWYGFLVRVCSLSLWFWQEPIPQGSGLQLCMAGVSNSLRYCNTWGTAIPAYLSDIVIKDNFKTTFWVNHWYEMFYCRCRWLVCINSFRCIAPNCWLCYPLIFCLLLRGLLADPMTWIPVGICILEGLLDKLLSEAVVGALSISQQIPVKMESNLLHACFKLH